MKVLTVEQVLEQHTQAVKDQDIERIAFDYAENAVFITTSDNKNNLERNIIKGKEAIKNVFRSVFTNIIPLGSKMEFTNQVVEGEIAYITWKAESKAFLIPSATDTFLIRNGKIVAQTGFTILCLK